MRRYSKDDINPMSWQEYGAAVQTLLEKIIATGLSFDAIAPILRSGGIPGNLLAIRLQITRIIPLQFKYVGHPARLEQMDSTPRPSIRGLSNILICDNNTSTGGTAQAAVARSKWMFPGSNLHYATVAKVFGGPDSLAGVAGYYFGIHTNERFLASTLQMKELSLRPGITLFPWEMAEDELREIIHFET